MLRGTLDALVAQAPGWHSGRPVMILVGSVTAGVPSVGKSVAAPVFAT